MVNSDRAKWRAFAVALLALTLLSACASFNAEPSEKPSSAATVTETNPLIQLRNAFRTIYADTISDHRRAMTHQAPVITQDLLNMTLHRENGERVRFEMDKRRYFFNAHTSHPPIALYAIMADGGFGALNDEQVAELSDYETVLSRAIEYVEGLDTSYGDKEGPLIILRNTREAITAALADRSMTQSVYVAYVRSIRDAIRANLYVGAREQLEQFMRQVHAWKLKYPEENWDELRVVVLGFHQPRDEYALKLLFQWLLNEPDYEQRVVYAEFQNGFSGRALPEAEELALVLLTKVDFELEAARLIFDDQTYLQRDVMGPAAIKILQEWEVQAQ